jgi:hypothetical protein
MNLELHSFTDDFNSKAAFPKDLIFNPDCNKSFKSKTNLSLSAP